MRFLYALFMVLIVSSAWGQNEPITPNNVTQIEPLQVIGEGTNYHLAYSPDGQTVALASSIGVKIFSADDLTHEIVFIKTLDPIFEVIYSTDSTRLVGRGVLGSIRVWDVGTGDEVWRLGEHVENILTVQISPNAPLILSISTDQAMLWHMETGEPLHNLKIEGLLSITGTFSPDGQQVFMAYDDGTGAIWDVETGEISHLLSEKHQEYYQVAYRPDGKELATESINGTLQVWDAQTGTLQNSWQISYSQLDNIAYISNDKLIFSVTNSGTIALWNVETGTAEWQIRSRASQVFPANNQLMVFSDGGSSIQVLDAQTGELLTELQGMAETIHPMVVAPDNSQIISTHWNHNGLNVWDAKTGEQLQTSTPASYIVEAHYTHDMTRVIALMENSNRIDLNVFNSQTQALLYTQHLGYYHHPHHIMLTPDERHFLRIGQTIDLFDIETGEEQASNLWGSMPVVYSPDQTLIASSGFGNLLNLFDARTGENIVSIEQHNNHLASEFILFPDNQSVLFLGQENQDSDHYVTRMGSFYRYDIETGEIKQLFPVDDVLPKLMFVGVSADGKQLITRDITHQMVIWDMTTGEQLFSASHVNATVMSNDNQLLAYIADDILWMWDASTDQHQRFEDYISPTKNFIFNDMIFSPDHQLLITLINHNTSYYTLGVWDVSTGNYLQDFAVSKNSIDVSFSLDGSRILTTQGDGTIRIWGIPE